MSKRRLLLGAVATTLLVAAAILIWKGRGYLEIAKPLLAEWWPVMASSSVLVLLGFAIWAVWKWPKYQVASLDVSSEGDRFRLENEARKTLAQIFGGIILLGGAFATVQTMQISQETLQASREAQVAERFTRAIEQVGATHNDKEKTPNIEVRLGGIYTLERVAETLPEIYHWTVMEVLTAYVRKNAPGKGANKEKENSDETQQEHIEKPGPTADVQAVVTVLGQRRATYGTADDQPLDLSRTDLRSANLGRSTLNRADYRNVYFIEADLREAYLFEADLHRAYLDSADLRGADFSRANLHRANLDYAALTGADFSEANLSEADLDGADLRDIRNLTCEQLATARFWEKAYRDSELACGAEIPEPQKENGGE